MIGEENAELNASKDGEDPNDQERARALGDEIMVLRKKSDEAQSAGVFDARSERLRIAMGLLERLAQYCSRDFGDMETRLERKEFEKSSRSIRKRQKI